jgi:predicted N-formylglutamate amidohydrolase
MIDTPFEMLGTPRQGGFLIIGDHASNRIPDDIDLGIDLALLREHIAWDIGVAEVTRLIIQDTSFAGLFTPCCRFKP